MIKKSRYESGWYFFSFVYNDVTSSKIDPKQSPRASHYTIKANLTHLFHLFKLLKCRSSKFDIKWRYHNYNCHFSCTYNLYWPHICCTVRLNSFSARTCFFDWRYKNPSAGPYSTSNQNPSLTESTYGEKLKMNLSLTFVACVCSMAVFAG